MLGVVSRGQAHVEAGKPLTELTQVGNGGDWDQSGCNGKVQKKWSDSGYVVNVGSV